MRFLFCPRCHRRIVEPAMLAKIKLGPDAKINVACGNCGKGKVAIKPASAKTEAVAAQ